MDIRQLECLRMIAEQGSFSAAARALGISQPSISQRMRELEAEIGERLFLRSHAGAQLTDLGRVVSGHAAEIARHIAQIRAAALSQRDDTAGEVSVGLPTTVALHLTVPIVREVRERFPGIRLRVVESMSGYLLEWLVSGRIDLAILYMAQGAPELRITSILTEELYLITARSGHDEARASITMQEVARLPLVLPSREHGLRRNIEAAVAGAGLALTVAVEIESLVHMKEYVREGGHHTILPFAAVRQETREGTLIARRIVQPVIRRPVAMAQSAGRSASQATRRVAEIVDAVVRRALRSGGELTGRARSDRP